MVVRRQTAGMHSMGVWYKIVNVAKRQYLCPKEFGEPFTRGCILDGQHAVAVSLLVCDSQSLGFDSPAGEWHGDPVFLVGDSGPPNQHGITTVTARDPDRNLYAMASAEFEDISLSAIIMLLAGRKGAADSLARRAAGNPYEGKRLLRNLGDILHSGLRGRIEVDADRNAEVLECALSRHVGPDWEGRYRSLSAGRSGGRDA